MRRFSLCLFTAALVVGITSCGFGHDVRSYARAYVRNYLASVEKHVPSQYQSQFSFYRDYPYRTVVTTAKNGSAAVEFIPDTESSYLAQQVDGAVEAAVIDDYDLGIFQSEEEIDYTLLVGRGESGPMFSVSGRLSISDLAVVTNRMQFLDVGESGNVLVENVVVDGIEYSHVLMKGRMSPWSSQAAIEDSSYHFEQDLRRAILGSEDFRQFFATQQLEPTAREIVGKEQNGGYAREGGREAFRADFQRLYEAAVQLGVTPEFAKAIYDFYSSQPPKASWWDRNPWAVQVATGIVATVLGTVVVRFLVERRTRKKTTDAPGSAPSKGTRRSPQRGRAVTSAKARGSRRPPK